jgi:hypothetical protein
MLAKNAFLICCMLVPVLSLFAEAPQSADFPKGITLSIDRNPGWIGGNEEGSALNIRCTFRNESTKALTFLLADHSDYHGTLPYPIRMSARIIDSNGNVLTHTEDVGDWWTSYILSSQSYREMPGNRVTLRPGENVIRIVPLKSVLAGLRNLPNGLKAGKYTVELKLGDIVSNPLKINVVVKE